MLPFSCHSNFLPPAFHKFLISAYRILIGRGYNLLSSKLNIETTLDGLGLSARSIVNRDKKMVSGDTVGITNWEVLGACPYCQIGRGLVQFSAVVGFPRWVLIKLSKRCRKCGNQEATLGVARRPANARRTPRYGLGNLFMAQFLHRR